MPTASTKTRSPKTRAKTEKKAESSGEPGSVQSSREETHTSNIAEPLRPYAVRLADLYTDPTNARRHPDRNLEAIKSSLRRFGQDQLIVAAEDGRIIVGNGRYEAARQLEWTHVAAIKVSLDKAEALARAIADNRTGELAEWNYEILSSQFKLLMEEEINLADFGWEPYEIEPLLAADWTPPSVDESFSTKPTAAKSHSLEFSPAEWRVVEEAAERVRATEENDSLTITQVLTLLCRRALEGAPCSKH